MTASAPDAHGDRAGLPARTILCDDADAVAHEAARRLISALAPQADGRLAVCLSGGSTPRRLYELLAGPSAGSMPWARIHWFFGDERLVAADHPDSNYRMVREAMLDRAPVPAGNVHPIDTGGRSAEEAAQAYEAVLAAFYGSDRLDPARPLFDVTLLGLGEDGHTASLFPGKPALATEDRLVVGVAEAGQPPFVPRVTLTLPALASSRVSLVLVAGSAKHAALARIAQGEDLPAGRVAKASGATWLVDRAAASGGGA